MVAVSAAIQKLLGDIKGSIGRVLRGERTCGTCFLIGRSYVVTCDHVLRGDEPVDLWFEGAPARVHEVRRWSLGPAIDLAILEIPAQDLLPIELVRGTVWGERFDTFGYPLAHGGGGVSASGTIEGPTSILAGGERGPRLELRAERIVPGFSGAPVLILVGDRAMAVGCISDTGSESYADVPSCAPVGELMNTPAIASLGIRVQEWKSVPPAATDSELSAWKLTRRVVETSTPAIDRDRAAIEIHAAIEAARHAAAFDDQRVRELRTILAALRTKYQASTLDLAQLVERLRGIDQPTIEMIVADLKLVPRHMMSLAAAHGAAIHRGVIEGWCLPDALFALDSADRYTWENLGRVVRSLVGLLEFDVGQLPTGFGRTGHARPVELDRLRALIAIARGYAPHLDVHGDQGASSIHIARLVGRKSAMRNPYIGWGPSGPVVFATSGGYLYRWRLDVPTPIADHRLAEDSLGIDEAFAAGDPTDPHMLVTTFAGPIAEVTPGGKITWVAHPRWSDKALWWRDPVSGSLVQCDVSSRTVLTLHDWTAHEQVARVDLSELPSKYPRLFEWPSDSGEHEERGLRGVEQIRDLSRSELLGDTCVVASVTLDPYGTGNAIFFLDSHTLAPVRAPVLTRLPVGRVSIARAQGKTLLLAPAIDTGVHSGGLYAWDLSQTVSKQAAPFLGAKHEEAGSDFVTLDVSHHDTGWDAYYVVHRLTGDRTRALWRLAWPEMSPQRIVDDLGNDFVASLHVVPRP